VVHRLLVAVASSLPLARHMRAPCRHTRRPRPKPQQGVRYVLDNAGIRGLRDFRDDLIFRCGGLQVTPRPIAALHNLNQQPASAACSW
jgi:hypothetical protein